MSSKLLRRKINPLGIPRHVERNDAITQYKVPELHKWIKDEEPKPLTPKEYVLARRKNPNIKILPTSTTQQRLVLRNLILKVSHNPNLTKTQKLILISRDYTNMLIDKDKPVYYVVQLGDNLYHIAKRNNLTLEELKALNPQLKGDTIHVGDRLRLRHGKSNLWVNVLKEQSFEKNYNTSNKDAILNYRHSDTFVIIDKAKGTLTIYDKFSNPIYTTTNISTGVSGDDYNTITYSDDSGNVKSYSGNMSTPAGITRIGSIYKNNDGSISFTRQRLSRDGNWEDIASSIHSVISAINNSHLSNGCIRVDEEDAKKLTQYIHKGTLIYTLPEKPGSRFILRAGKLNFVADNPYGNNTGPKKYWDDYNVHIDKSYNPLSIKLVKKRNNPVYNINAQLYADAISSEKRRIQQLLGLSNDEYNHLAQIAMGVGLMESEFGTNRRYLAKTLFALTMYHTGKYIYENLKGIIEKDPKYHPLVSNSRGITLIKYNDDISQSKDLRKLYSQYGINDGDDLEDPGKAGIATILRLGYIYNTEIKGRNFTGHGKEVSPWDALIYAYNGRLVQLRDKTATPDKNGYIKGVNNNAKNFEYLEYRTYDE